MGRWMIPLALVAAPASAQPLPANPPVIRVIGHGVVKTTPDVATIEYVLRGEGGTSDEAARALAVRRAATDAVLAGRAEVRTGKLAIAEARDKACDGDHDDKERTRLSTGACAVTGYVATLGVTARVTPVADAGTLLGLVGRAGGVGPHLENFDLRDPTPAQRAATATAMADARRQAEAIAAASGARLGRLRRVEDQRAGREDAMNDVVTVSGLLRLPKVNAPVEITLTPEPIETEASLVVEFEIGSAS